MPRLVITVPAAEPGPEALVHLAALLEAPPGEAVLRLAASSDWTLSELLGEVVERSAGGSGLLDEDGSFEAELEP